MTVGKELDTSIVAEREEAERNAEVHQLEPTAPYAVATPTPAVFVPSTSATTTPTTPSPSGVVPPPPEPTSAPPPRNAPPGGYWENRKYLGPATWSTCTTVSIVTCFFCLFPCGVWALLCPCDQRRVYVVHGTLYDEHGKVLN
jgi:hypothetical protein